MVKDFGSHGQANKARGAVRRLELDSKELELAGTTLTGSSFDVKSMKSKVVLVYFWASWNQQCAGDFVKLKSLLTTYGPKGLEVVGISLDDNQQAARDFVQRNSAPGTELYEQGGMSSKLGEQYGIMVLPTMFLVKEGKVVNHNAQMTTVEDELKKQMP
jgi:thiol-disulfide isomerase/thioredoxin